MGANVICKWQVCCGAIPDVLIGQSLDDKVNGAFLLNPLVSMGYSEIRGRFGW